MPVKRQMRADLVGLSRNEPDFQKACPFPFFQRFIFRYDGNGIRNGRFVNFHRRGGCVLDEIVAQNAAVGFKRPVYFRKVIFFEGARFKTVQQFLFRRLVFGEEHHAVGIRIEPMDEIRFPAAGKFLEKRFAFHPFSLIDGEKVCILVEHGMGGGGVDIRGDLIPRPYGDVLPHADAVDPDVPPPQRLLRSGVRHAVFRKQFNDADRFCTYNFHHGIFRSFYKFFLS